MINKNQALNGTKYFSSGILHNYLIFILATNISKILVAQLRCIRINLMECQKKVLTINYITTSDNNFSSTFFTCLINGLNLIHYQMQNLMDTM